MVELTIGSRFYYKDKLCEVAEYDNNLKCDSCVFQHTKKCYKQKCSIEMRHDNKEVYFKEVKE